MAQYNPNKSNNICVVIFSVSPLHSVGVVKTSEVEINEGLKECTENSIKEKSFCDPVDSDGDQSFDSTTQVIILED